MSEQEQDSTVRRRPGSSTMRSLLPGTLVLVAVFFAGYFSGRLLPNPAETSARLQELHGNTEIFINPLIECNERDGAVEFVELRPFKRKIVKLADQLKKDGLLTHISVYFRDLNNGPWFGISEKEKFTPASLLKVPMMMAGLMIAETDHSFLRKPAVKTETEDFNAMETFKPSQAIVPNRPYRIEELIRRMIVYSDNNALRALEGQISPERISAVFSDLSIPMPLSPGAEDYLTVKEFASFFRVLFNASYLNKEMSKKALQILSEVEFDQGLSAGIPPEIGIVHKFGERIVKLQDTSVVQLHDCGIIYYPEHPYLLCIMTRGTAVDPVLASIREISRAVFTEVNRQYTAMD